MQKNFVMVLRSCQTIEVKKYDLPEAGAPTIEMKKQDVLKYERGI